MNGMLGMDTTTGAQVARTVQGLSGSLELIEQQVALARLMSLSPMNWGIVPGSPVLSPASIQMGAQVTRELANVQQNLAYFAAKLTQEAQQQELVSNSLTPSDPGWFAPGPTARRPDEIGLWEEEFDLIGRWGEGWDDFWNTVGDVWEVASNVEFWVGLVTGTIEAGTAIFTDTVRRVTDWWNGVLDDGPRWLRPAFETTVDLVDRFGKFLPWVGTGFGGINTIVDWDDDNPWGNTRNIIGNVIDVASIVTLIPPLTPAAPFVAGAGVVWDLFDTAWDEYDKGTWQWPWE